MSIFSLSYKKLLFTHFVLKIAFQKSRKLIIIHVFDKIKTLAKYEIYNFFKYRTTIKHFQFIESLYILMKNLFFIICERVKIIIFGKNLIITI